MCRAEHLPNRVKPQFSHYLCSGRSVVPPLAVFEEDGWRVSWSRVGNGEWGRVEYDCGAASQDARFVKIRLAYRGERLTSFGPVYLICRHAGVSEKAYVVEEKLVCNGERNVLNMVVSIEDTLPAIGSRWSVALQSGTEAILEAVSLEVEYLSADAQRSTGKALAREHRRGLATHRTPVSIVVCVHNAREMSLRCLQSVLRHRLPDTEVVIVNDGSALHLSEAIYQMVSDEPDVTYVEERFGSGYTKAVNRGLRLAGGAIVLLLNSDTVVPKGWLPRIIKPLTGPSEGPAIVGALSNRATIQSFPLIEYAGGWARNGAILPSNFEFFDCILEEVARKLEISAIPVKLVNGFCMALKRQVFEECGLFDEDVFATGYGEETDLQMRAAVAGFTCAIVPNLLVYHEGSSSYDRQDLKTYQDMAFRRVSLKHGLAAIDSAYKVSRQALQDFPGREVMQSFFDGHKLFMTDLVHDGVGIPLEQAVARVRAKVQRGVDLVLENPDTNSRSNLMQRQPKMPNLRVIPS